MNKLHKLVSSLIIFTVCLLSVAVSSAETKLTTIKVAILDNFHFQAYITNKFGQRYINGVKLASFNLRKSGYSIKYKTFNYDRTHPLAIFKSINKVKAWHPDVILGPRNSNMFLLTRGAFKRVLVLSAFATSDDVQSMPKNYYSLMIAEC
jgi:hypothetical protein